MTTQRVNTQTFQLGLGFWDKYDQDSKKFDSQTKRIQLQLHNEMQSKELKLSRTVNSHQQPDKENPAY